jgi:oligoendopeptidase F
MSTPMEEVVWRLDDLYEGPDDPQLEKDREWCRNEADAFAREYQGRVEELNPAELLEAIVRYETLQERAQKLFSYAYLAFSTRTDDPQAGALLQSLQEFYSLLHRDTLFFELEWTQIEEKEAWLTMSHPDLSHYRHYLETLRRYRPHVLSEIEERLLAEKEPAGAAAWHTLFDKVISNTRFGEQNRTESEVLADLHSSDRGVRENAAGELTEGLQNNLHVLTHIFNTVLLDKSINDRLRDYPHWLRARNLANEISDEMVNALVDAVVSRYDVVERYYRLKRRLLGVDRLYDYDRYAPVPGMPETTFTWDQAKEVVLTAYGEFSSEMADIARLFFDNNWIHAPVRAGKRGGAYSHPVVPSAHPYVFLNFTGRHRDVMTLAHELGHGVHQYLARRQGLINSSTPLTTAETASVFGEMLVFQYMLRQMDHPRERLALRCAKLEEAFATVFRQVTMNRFENHIHTERREAGELSPDRLSEFWMETQQAMFGGSVELLDHYRIWWSYIPHFIHVPGYVYAYAFGELLVFALYRRYMETGEEFVPLYLELLASGGKDRPELLLEPLDIELTDPGFWHQGLSMLESLLEEAEAEAGRE